MKKMILTSLLISCVFVGSEQVMAVESVTTEGTATLEALEEGEAGSVAPILPDPDNSGGTGQTGLLTIDAVPQFDFKGEGLSGTFTDTLTASQSAANYTRNAQVTDRRGTGEGWSLGLNISPFKSNGTALRGMTMSIPVSVSPVNGNASNAPSIVNNIQGIVDTTNGLDAGPIVVAESGEGLGTWVTEFQNAEVTISDGNVAGAYHSTFTWSLSALPVGE
ncbi:WxL domain-containing protein [Enterococcus sp. DIV0242_7C1]|uniref:WxL domain-containing protein n=1 Tax=Candidatus Enterococcus dunnyi TaxID=1834192 RepID=A0A200IZD0_9ENTE|nr:MULTISPECIES: WxL domain-containing protein [unclassified Enterococcus]MBO0470288.1 WxL domain-containing protein [Enterococcus sp. DIV0242_7C1]OUZ30346.1 hypothetical protein A5889_002634 [Enterococcus sp. 9D6_DIV0238]